MNAPPTVGRRERNLFNRCVGRCVRWSRELRLISWRLQGAQIDPSARAFGRLSYVGELAHLTVGRRSTLNQGVHLNLLDRITVGDDVHISAYVQLHTGSLNPSSDERTHVSAAISVEDRAWIAAGAFVGAGVTIGEGAIVAAGAVVIDDVDPWTMVGGTPATLIRTLLVQRKGVDGPGSE